MFEDFGEFTVFGVMAIVLFLLVIASFFLGIMWSRYFQVRPLKHHVAWLKRRLAQAHEEKYKEYLDRWLKLRNG